MLMGMTLTIGDLQYCSNKGITMNLMIRYIDIGIGIRNRNKEDEMTPYILSAVQAGKHILLLRGTR